MENLTNYNADFSNPLLTEEKNAATEFSSFFNLGGDAVRGMPSIEADIGTVEQTRQKFDNATSLEDVQLQSQADIFLKEHAYELQQNFESTEQWQGFLTDIFSTNSDFQSIPAERLELLRDDFIDGSSRPVVGFVEPDVLLDSQGQSHNAAFDRSNQTILLANNVDSEAIQAGIEQELGHWWDMQLHGTNDTTSAEGTAFDEGAAYAERFNEGARGDSLYADSIYQNDRHKLFVEGQAIPVEFSPEDTTYIGTPSNETINTSDGRYIGNKVNESFEGSVDVWYDPTVEGRENPVFATNVDVTEGQAWPRVTEGITNGSNAEPESVENYIQSDRYVTYDGNWEEGASGPRYNGAYLWTNDPNNVYEDGSPRWEFTTEINIWNRADNGIPPEAEEIGEYYDSNGKYTVSYERRSVPDSGLPDGTADFDAYFFVLDNEDGPIDDMEINTTEILKYLVDKNPDLKNQEVIQTSIAAEGHAGSKGKFTAEINTMK